MFKQITGVVLAGAMTPGGCAMTKEEAGTATGAVAGGVLGSTIGDGSGQIAATFVGAVLGALVGQEIGRSLETASMNCMHSMYWSTTVSAKPPAGSIPTGAAKSP